MSTAELEVAPAREEPSLPAARRRRVPAAGTAARLLAVLGLTAWLGFSDGGFFVGETGLAAVIACVALLLWAMTATAPVAGLGAAGVAGLAALSLLGVWVLASSAWSDAAARSVYEFDRVLLYLAVFALVALAPRGPATARWLLRGFAVVLGVVSLLALVSRLYPDVVGSPTVSQAHDRLGWPLGYWNALGLCAAMAAVLCVHLTSELRERVPVRVLAAAAVPALVVTMYLTLSRGGFGAAVIGFVLLVVLGRSRGLVGGLLAVLPAVALAVLAAAAADAVTTGYDPDAAASLADARELGGRLGLICAGAALLRLLAVPLDRWLARLRLRPWGRPARAALVIGVAALLVIGGLAVDAPDRLSVQWESFKSSAPTENEGGGRLLETTANGRIEHWEVAWDTFQAHPWVGTGAGTFVYEWAERRTLDFPVQDAHSIYLDVLADLGLVGLALLLVALLVPFGAALVRRREDRVLWSAVVAVTGMWLVRAGIDWDWEVPALTLPAVALLAVACARDAGRPAGRRSRGRVPRILVGLAILLLVLTPARVWSSQRALNASLEAFRQGDCATSVDKALAAQKAFGARPEPFELLGYCDVRVGQSALGEKMLEAAIRKEPRSWELHYGLALVRGARREDPRPALLAARRRSPTEPKVLDALERMRSDRPRVWRREALKSPLVVPSPPQNESGA